MSRNISAGKVKYLKKFKETYIALNFLGKGSFGDAYLIKSEQSDINYVLKIISLVAFQEEDYKNVLNEAILLKMIDHPNIIRFKEVFKVIKPIQQLNIIMEYANGGDINQKIIKQNSKFFEEKLLIDWLTQLCHALQYIHNKKIIHRDIKPANIFLNNLGQIKLGDFGVSKNLQSLKMANTFIGSVDYMAPEVVEGKNYSFEADIWSLGVTFYELMTFNKPFKGRIPSIFLKILNDKIEPITDFYSKEFRNLIYKMLDKNPLKRPKAKEILNIPFVKNRMLSYLQEKRFNFKDSLYLIQNYQMKKNQKYNNYLKGSNFNNRNKLKSINNNIISNNNNKNNFKYKFHFISNKEIDKKLINQRYKIFDEKENINTKLENKDKNDNFIHSMQNPEKRNKITLSSTKISNTSGNIYIENKKYKINDFILNQQNNVQIFQFKNEKNIDIYKKNNSYKESSIELPHNEKKNFAQNDKDNYDFHRQMNIFCSLINGVKTDEQIEEENNIILKNNEFENFY